jgi:hypothetical protein
MSMRHEFAEYAVEFDEDTGRMAATRHGEPWRELTGDGMVLAMLQEVDRLKRWMVMLELAKTRQAPRTTGRGRITGNYTLRTLHNPEHDDSIWLIGLSDGTLAKIPGMSILPYVDRNGNLDMGGDVGDLYLLAGMLHELGFGPVQEPEEPKAAPVATKANPYGYCPVCGAPGVRRERRPDGNDECASGHRYASAKALIPPKSAKGTRTEGHGDKPSGVPVPDGKTD